jgi:low affinity Fe/Cu permease
MSSNHPVRHPVATERAPAGHSHAFIRLAALASYAAGRPVTFGIAVASVVIWAVLGPVFKFSNTWQLAINTGTTVATFLMVFLIQSTQNRDTTAIQIKLDELIRVSAQARNAFITLEELDDEELERLRTELHALARRKPVGVTTPDRSQTTRRGPADTAGDNPSVTDLAIPVREHAERSVADRQRK